MAKQAPRFVTLTSASGESGSYYLLDPAVGGYFPEAEPCVTRPKGMVVQRTWSKKLAPERGLELVSESGAIVVRADIAKELGLASEPITVVMTKGKRVKGWVIVTVDAWIAPGETPSAPLSREVANPRTIIAEETLAKRLAALTGNAIRAVRDDETGAVFAPPWLKLPNVPPAAWAGLATALRAKQAAPATRTAACKHAITATLYAILVDRAAVPATRKAAAAVPWCAYLYAFTLDRAIDDALAKRLIASGGWDAPSIAEERQRLAELAGEPAPQPQHATRDVPRLSKRAPRIDASITDAEVRADIDEMTGRGLARLEITGDEPDLAPLVIDRLHAYVDEHGPFKGKAGGIVKLELACAWAEALHRAFGWQWASIATDDGKTVGIVSPTRSHANSPLSMIREQGENPIALSFNMIAAKQLPEARRGALVFIS